MPHNSKLLFLNINLKTQRGQALLALLVLLTIGAGAAFYTLVRPANSAIEKDKITAAALAQAKEALISYAVSDNNRPGSLPCPDLITNMPGNTPNDGTTDLYAGNECPGFIAGSNVYLGRLPWRTLGLPDLRDGSGERLWYAVSRDFARNPTCMTPSVPGCPLNSDTLGQLTVTGVAPVSNVVAIVFAPGTALGNQTRDAAGANTASNYLEGENVNGNNSIFTAQENSSTFNDELLAITNRDLMPAVEQRVAREMISLLNQYRAATATSPLYPGGIYPWADLDNGLSNGTAGAAYNRNRFPCSTIVGPPSGALPVNWNTLVPSSTPPTSTPALPNWLTNGCWATGWTSLIYYAVARNRLETGGAICTTCSATSLSVTNPSSRVGTVCTTSSPPVCTMQVITPGNADLVLITPGAATASRASGWPTAFSTITLYFEDTENSDNNNSNDNYTVPASTNYDRDRIYVVR